MTDGFSAKASELASSFDEIKNQTKKTAANAAKVYELSAKALESATRGHSSMSEMLDAIEGIRVSSENISKIIKTIDEIAMQTNLLALNAAVEAAHAGVYGRGFMVVAEEVRTLAGKSKQAANQTKELILESMEKVKQGVLTARNSETEIKSVITNVQDVNSVAKEISETAAGRLASVERTEVQVLDLEAKLMSPQQSTDLVYTGTEARPLSTPEGLGERALVRERPVVQKQPERSAVLSRPVVQRPHESNKVLTKAVAQKPLERGKEGLPMMQKLPERAAGLQKASLHKPPERSSVSRKPTVQKHQERGSVLSKPQTERPSASTPGDMKLSQTPKVAQPSAAPYAKSAAGSQNASAVPKPAATVLTKSQDMAKARPATVTDAPPTTKSNRRIEVPSGSHEYDRKDFGKY